MTEQLPEWERECPNCHHRYTSPFPSWQRCPECGYVWRFDGDDWRREDT